MSLRGTGDVGLRRVFTEIAILMNYAGFTKKFLEIVIVTLRPFGRCSTIKICFLRFRRKRLSVALLHFHHIVQFSRCSLQPLLKPDLKTQTLLDFEIQQQILSGGPEWARTTDLTIISRTL